MIRFTPEALSLAKLKDEIQDLRDSWTSHPVEPACASWRDSQDSASEESCQVLGGA